MCRLRERAVLVAAENYGTACKRLEAYLKRVPGFHSDFWSEETRESFDRLLADVQRNEQLLLRLASKYRAPLRRKAA